MAGTKNKPVKIVTKSYLTGSVFDENSVKNILKFFGMMVLFLLMAFLVSMMAGFGSRIIQIIFNSAIILLLLYIVFTRGMSLGTDAVARGEIMFQRKENGAQMAEGEQKLCYHPAKGFVIALLGILPFLIPAVILAFAAEKQITSTGTIPTFAGTLARRSEIGDALQATYLDPKPLMAVDYLRAFVRACLMPVFRMIDLENKDMILTVERLSPVFLLFPCAAYGIGYLQGPAERTRTHTRIAENRRIRARKEAKERKARMAEKGPDQLN